MIMDIEGYTILGIVADQPNIWPAAVRVALADCGYEWSQERVSYRAKIYTKGGLMTRERQPNRVLLRITKRGMEVINRMKAVV